MKRIMLAPHILKFSFKLTSAFQYASKRDYAAALGVLAEIEKGARFLPNGEHLLLKAHCLYRLENEREAISTFELAWKVCKDHERMNADEEKFISDYIHAHLGQEMMGLSESERETVNFNRKNVRRRYQDQFGTKVST